ncbi:shikimate dehydrogenase [Galbitalea sp. SE-J8]|uniref:shikimate dehydrogenase n=1 Tax=Galbitalea sp. SE-J8 TaxID=3054952 RepID=UPI00259CDD21|nr:shikimate dehydrogenase [Galbitalea sp. SE-J8]MDM4762032.1 shikimate dehydrogenase [Galbitalea sp. SE-J8]
MVEPTPLMPSLTGSFSSPAGGNPTGAMVEAAYAHHGILARYVNAEVRPAGLAAAVAGAKAMGWLGFNCSLPHKQAVIPLLDELAQSARLIGAVNCAVERDGAWVGENTDGQGFVAALREIVDPAGQRVVVLGAGGAGRAIAVELALAGAASVTIVNRDVEKARALADVIVEGTTATARAEAWLGDHAVAADATVVVNATSVGLAPRIDERLAVDLETIRAGVVVCDVIPNPPVTPFLRAAAERGARTLDGRGMLAQQAARNVELWTGVRPDLAVMRTALDRAIGDWRHPTSS